MEQHYSKDQLLEIYFNTTYFGAGATGIKSAALTYFDKLPQEMQLAECAIIAGSSLCTICTQSTRKS